jgi:hypothetical protein
VSWPIAERRTERYRRQDAAGMADRSSRPHHTRPVHRSRVARKIVWACRLSHICRATGEPIRRHEQDRPGAMLYVDVEEPGNTPTAAAGGPSARATARRLA